MELQRLREEEESVRREIEETLAKENLDKERAMAGESSADEADIGAVKSSASLLNDIDEVQRKVDNYSKARRQFDDDRAQRVVSCYK
jgi:altered-inheritance-of-mitochondria protein 13